jgi:hypothetical protein
MGLFTVVLLIGLVGAIAFAATRPPGLRRVLLIAILIIVNVGEILYLAPAYLVSRLDGSMPPSLSEFLAPHSLLILLVLTVNVVIFYLLPRFRRDELPKQA